jgi:Icc-related predicted phosphoesterase
MEKDFVFISDTHCKHSSLVLPEGDTIIHCGDVSSIGSITEIKKFSEWFGNLPYENKIMIPGNHDFAFEKYPEESSEIIKEKNIICLINQGIEVYGLKIWGSPITPYFRNWAFNRFRGSEIQSYWDRIPDDTDILITHGPPAYLKNLSFVLGGEDVGCEDLYNTIKKRVKPKISSFGHIHEGYGIHQDEETIFINCSLLNTRYELVNDPFKIRYKEGKFFITE